ncbi:MAG: hypothetical protein NDI77_11905 [Geobacteraceae bacterium]|nr:hypothetical protein [Geobacteraceae bacterium]
MADGTTSPFEEGLQYLAKGNATEAEIYFEEAASGGRTPLLSAYLAYCKAKVHGEFKPAIALGLEAVRQEPRNSQLYLLLGRIHLLAGQKGAAIRVFQLGLRCERNAAIHDELGALGVRRPPPLPFLKRSNPINKHLGLFLKRVGLR